MKYHETILETIGKTPLVKIDNGLPAGAAWQNRVHQPLRIGQGSDGLLYYKAGNGQGDHQAGRYNN